DGLAPEPPADRLRSGFRSRCWPVGSSPWCGSKEERTLADPELGMPATVLPLSTTDEGAVDDGSDDWRGSAQGLAHGGGDRRDGGAAGRGPGARVGGPGCAARGVGRWLAGGGRGGGGGGG